MSDAEKSPTMPDLLWQLGRTIFRREALLSLLLVSLLVGVGGVGVAWAQSSGKEAIKREVVAGIDERVVPLKLEVKALQEKLDVVAEAQAAQKREAEDARRESREQFGVLYQVILTGEPSRKAAALMQPLDGGR